MAKVMTVINNNNDNDKLRNLRLDLQQRRVFSSPQNAPRVVTRIKLT